MIKRLFMLCLFISVLSACANDPAPLEQLRLTEQTLAQTHALGLNGDSSVLLELAQSKYEQAQAKLVEGENKQARLLAEQAELDARLAEAQFLSDKSRQQVTDLSLRITRLRQQLGSVQ